MARPTTHLPALPFLFYENPGDAIEWLTHAFGATERFRLTLSNGAVAHAEIEIGRAVIMIGNVGPRNQQEPRSVRSAVYVFVPNVQDHFAHAHAAGARIVESPRDQPFGARIYVAEDCEGHEWYFAQHLRDVDIAELQSILHVGTGMA